MQTTRDNGSSPLTRGKRHQTACRVRSPRLIPAHAGKTRSCRLPWRGAPAHPRSRGENASASCSSARRCGSSPLTRGKLLDLPLPAGGARLIPAHAGKTLAAVSQLCAGAAHPRSRGENTCSNDCDGPAHGSSPLTRGKPVMHIVQRLARRLIPAHAGKTTAPRARSPPRAAHPRSRGENGAPPVVVLENRGSSPLTRGKLPCLPYDLPRGRLIPAHAGKTDGWTWNVSRIAAHPRSRGENRALEG